MSLPARWALPFLDAAIDRYRLFRLRTNRVDHVPSRRVIIPTAWAFPGAYRRLQEVLREPDPLSRLGALGNPCVTAHPSQLRRGGSGFACSIEHAERLRELGVREREADRVLRETLDQRGRPNRLVFGGLPGRLPFALLL